MIQAYSGPTAAIHETHESCIEQMANLVAAYRRAIGNRSDFAMLETDQCVSAGVDLQVLKQLAQFDKLLVALK
jgi:hypothetical protein